MIRYLVRRILLFIPTLIIISLLAFIISINAPGDPVERMISVSASEGLSNTSQNSKALQQYWRTKLGLDLPVFYFSVAPMSEPKELNQITDDSERNSVERLSRLTGNPESTMQLHLSRLNFSDFLSTGKNISPAVLEEARLLKYATTPDIIQFRIDRLKKLLSADISPVITGHISNLENDLQNYNNSQTPLRNYIPAISFHKQNQYHRWVFGDGNWITGKGAVNSKGIIRGDFGLSYLNRQPVSQVIVEKAGWSMFFALTAILIAYLVSIPIGLLSAAKKDSLFDRISSVILFLMFSLPVFWLATLLLMTFANPDVLHIFPASGVKPATGYPEHAGLAEKIRLSLPFIILPLICYSYGGITYCSRVLRAAVLETLSQDFIRTAKAKGLSFRTVLFRHAFRNSLFPLITVFATVFPLLISGAVIIETIFTIPGMGFETVHSIQNQNYPMIVAIFTITGVLTMMGYLVSDILYAMADPRIIFEKK